MPQSLLGVEAAFYMALILGDYGGNNAGTGGVRPKDEPALSELETAGRG